MSGFAGFTGRTEDREAAVGMMIDTIRHRGPDSGGVYFDANLSAGFRLLNEPAGISGGPLTNEDGSLILFSDARLYNYPQLKTELESCGHVFKTRSGAEAILHLYEQYGAEMFRHMRGMFAFAIYNKNDGSIFFARDHFGIKPLYYAEYDGGLMFGSELKCLAAHPRFVKILNEAALECYLSFQYSARPETFFKGAYRLPPGSYMEYHNGAVALRKYFIAEFSPDENISPDAAAEMISAAVEESIAAHSADGAEIGAFLSSGVDSSFVAARFRGTKTFTVGFGHEDYNEITYAAPLSELISKENLSKTIAPGEYWDALPEVMYQMDEPLADPSAVALYFASKLAAKHVAAAFSGEAVDEFFGGYNIYKETVDLRPLTALPRPIAKTLGRLARAVPFSFKGKNYLIRGSKTLEERFIGNANIFSRKEINTILKNPAGRNLFTHITKPYYDKIKNLDDVVKMQFIDINLWMPGDILLKADRMTSAHSLEVRAPYLDAEVFKVASKLPSKLKVSKDGTKLAFRMVAAKYLPPETAGKKKLGFPVPVRVWLRDKKYFDKIKGAFESEAAVKYFITDELLKLLDAHYSGKRDASRKIWTVYVFIIWYGQYFG